MVSSSERTPKAYLHKYKRKLHSSCVHVNTFYSQADIVNIERTNAKKTIFATGAVHNLDQKTLKQKFLHCPNSEEVVGRISCQSR